MTVYFCCDELRRNAVKAHSTLNGIDFLEVLDDPDLPDDQRQRTLFVHFVKFLSPGALTKDNVRIDGGERIRNIAVASVSIGTGDDDHILTVQVEQAGDFSTYRMSLVQSVTVPNPPTGFDPRLSQVDFSFKVECPTDFDCKPQRICPPEELVQPEIDYLTKDYATFRRLMLDRISLVSPYWTQRNTADLGVTLVELLAFVGDYLSYQQDAIATEAYLGTARRRVSVRRHARLVDYFMHDGQNARTWVQVQVNADNVSLAAGSQLMTRLVAQATRISPNSSEHDQALAEKPVVFATMQDVTLFEAHNEMAFYTWGDERCCLPKGALRAALRDGFPNLKTGDVLIFEEKVGPLTGLEADADAGRRHALRLTKVTLTEDPAGGRFEDPPNDNPVPITEIEWADDDKLPFAICISARTDAEHGEQDIDAVSVARGNIVLADHGMTIKDESLGNVPAPTLFKVPETSDDRCQSVQRDPIFPRFGPALQERPLTQAAPFDPAASSASAAMRQAMRDVVPKIVLQLNGDTESWRPKRDLLNSAADKREFAVEIETDGTVSIRFGDDVHGRRPEAGNSFTAEYRVGNGRAGNIGAEALAHIVSGQSAITAVRNPIPAKGGVDSESIEDVRQRAPSAYRTQQRAVTEEDYAKVTERHVQVQQAEATLRWTGSWHTVFVTVDRLEGRDVDPEFEEDMRRHIEQFRMAGHDLEIDGPRFVSLKIEMLVCVAPDYFRSDVREALLEKFNNRTLPDGTRGVFHPDNFTFGQTVYLSRLIAAAQDVAGVTSVEVTVFERQRTPDPVPMEEGSLPLSRLEIARLDNDPNFPEHGVFSLKMGGGK